MASAMATVLGLDIGGANLKAAHTNGMTRSQPFALWKDPHGLTAALGDLTSPFPRYDLLAVTITGELCDCFATKPDGVRAILASASEAADSIPISVWSTRGRFLSLADANADPLSVAAANWLALATWAGRLVPQDRALLIDMGSTTTDIIPLDAGRPIPQGRTDAERLKTGELVYMGWRRTPIAALLNIGSGLTAEYFASTLDALLLQGVFDEDHADCDTADGRP